MTSNRKSRRNTHHERTPPDKDRGQNNSISTACLEGKTHIPEKQHLSISKNISKSKSAETPLSEVNSTSLKPPHGESSASSVSNFPVQQHSNTSIPTPGYLKSPHSRIFGSTSPVTGGSLPNPYSRKSGSGEDQDTAIKVSHYWSQVRQRKDISTKPSINMMEESSFLPAPHQIIYSRTPSPSPWFSPISLDNSQEVSSEKIQSINIPAAEECLSSSQRELPYLDTETSDIDKALAEWSPQHQQEREIEDLEILFTNIQNPPALTRPFFSSSPTDISEPSILLSIPNKDCSPKTLLQKLRVTLSPSAPCTKSALSILDHKEASLQEFTSCTHLHSSSQVRQCTSSSCLRPAQIEPSSLNQNPSASHFIPQVDSSKPLSILIHPSASSSTANVSDLLTEALPVTKAQLLDIKQTRNKGFLVSFQSPQDKITFQKEIAASEHLRDMISLNELPKRNPSIIIYDIPRKIVEPTIQQGLKLLNSSFPNLKLKFVFKGRTTEMQNWVFEVPAQYFHLFKNVHSIPINWTPFKVLDKYVPTTFLCFDKDGSVVRITDAGRTDLKGLWNVAKNTELAKYVAFIMEQDKERVIKQGRNLGKPLYSAIYDFENLSYANAVSVKTLQFVLYVLKMFVDNYPETIRRLIVINAPIYFAWLYAAIKPILPDTIIRKVRIYGTGTVIQCVFR
ncbi:Retinal-binding protein [Araneus ventricosus]|uniref:Retinal-binding protein n=1 Tax=Araneus ventricosus TaxID=182803 RepID=A0A4Y2RHD0_ARAVE|nr:Retinal-binding protein [Araneus ventricosus]